MGDIFREVDEELKQERYEKLWRQYGKYIIAAAVVLVLAVAGWKAWDGYRTSQLHEDGEKFTAAAILVQTGKAEEAAAAFEQVGAEAGSGYGALARFYEASIRAKGGDRTGAIEIYDSVAADESLPASMRELATVLGGLQALNVPSIEAAAVDARIEPLTRAGGPFRHVALEIVALNALRANDAEKAKTSYRAIVDDAEAPPGIRGRASQMLSILGES